MSKSRNTKQNYSLMSQIAREGKRSVIKSKANHTARKQEKALFKRMWNEELLT